MSMFKPAVKHESKLRLAISGPSGSGKTYTSLALALALAGGKPVAMVDTEHGSAAKYADLFAFDVMEMQPPFHPDRFGDAIRDAAKAGYGVIILDSLTHAWSGSGGMLDIVDEFAKRTPSGNTFTAWKSGTPIQNRLIDNIVQAEIHVIATMRSKQEFVQEKDDRGKTVVRKVGMAAQQRDGFEYEFDVVLDMDSDNNAIVSKTRAPALAGKVFAKPGQNVADILTEWLKGVPAETHTVTQPSPEPTTPAQSAPPAAQTGNGNDAAHVALPPEVKMWESPQDAYDWAIGIGASDNVHSARAAFANAAKAHGGKLTKSNAPAVYLDFYTERMARAQEKRSTPADIDMATLPGMNPDGPAPAELFA